MSSSKGGSRSSSNNSHVFPNAGRELLLELKRSSVSSNTAGGTSSSYLPPYNTKLTRACLLDLKDSVQTLKDIVHASTTKANNNDGVDDGDDEDYQRKPSMSSRPSILFHQASIQRNKRCLLAYHKNRMDQLMRNSSQYYHNHVVTTAGTTASPSNNNNDNVNDDTTTGQQQQQQQAIDNTNNNLHPLEIQFVKEYYELRQLYADTIDIDTMLGTSNNMLPPPTSNSYQIQVRVLKTLGPIVLEYSGRSVNFSKGSCLFMSRNDAMEFLQMGILEYMDGEEVDF